jgi:hypothetical protein
MWFGKGRLRGPWAWRSRRLRGQTSMQPMRLSSCRIPMSHDRWCAAAAAKVSRQLWSWCDHQVSSFAEVGTQNVRPSQ